MPIAEDQKPRLAKHFRRLTSIPFLFVFLAFLMPLVVFSCASTPGVTDGAKKIASFNAYELANGISFKDDLKDNETFQKRLLSLEKANPEAFKQIAALEQPSYVLYIIFIGILLASIFAWFSPLGSLVMGLCSFSAMWIYLDQLTIIFEKLGLGAILFAEAAHGAYAASMLMIIGFAMNITSIVRPFLDKRREKKKISTSENSKN